MKINFSTFTIIYYKKITSSKSKKLKQINIKTNEEIIYKSITENLLVANLSIKQY